MVNAKLNTECDDFKRGRVKECWTCECGKHHECKDGADKCCTDTKSKICKCRHCDIKGG